MIFNLFLLDQLIFQDLLLKSVGLSDTVLCMYMLAHLLLKDLLTKLVLIHKIAESVNCHKIARPLQTNTLSCCFSYMDMFYYFFNANHFKLA